MYQALHLLSEKLNEYLKLHFSIQGSKVLLNTILNDEGVIPVENKNKVVLTLVNINQNTAKDFPQQPVKNNSIALSNTAAVDYNLQVLVTPIFDNYNEALQFLFQSNSYFQENLVFTPANTPALKFEVSKLTVEVENINFSEMQNIWSAIGTNHRPSLLLKVHFDA